MERTSQSSPTRPAIFHGLTSCRKPSPTSFMVGINHNQMVSWSLGLAQRIAAPPWMQMTFLIGCRWISEMRPVLYRCFLACSTDYPIFDVPNFEPHLMSICLEPCTVLSWKQFHWWTPADADRKFMRWSTACDSLATAQIWGAEGVSWPSLLTLGHERVVTLYRPWEDRFLSVPHMLLWCPIFKLYQYHRLMTLPTMP